MLIDSKYGCPKCDYISIIDGYTIWYYSTYQGHPTTVFGEISVRSPLEWLKFSGAQEQLKISKMFRGDCSLGSEFRDLCGLFT